MVTVRWGFQFTAKRGSNVIVNATIDFMTVLSGMEWSTNSIGLGCAIIRNDSVWLGDTECCQEEFVWRIRRNLLLFDLERRGNVHLK